MTIARGCVPIGLDGDAGEQRGRGRGVADDTHRVRARRLLATTIDRRKFLFVLLRARSSSVVITLIGVPENRLDECRVDNHDDDDRNTQTIDSIYIRS